MIIAQKRWDCFLNNYSANANFDELTTSILYSQTSTNYRILIQPFICTDKLAFEFRPRHFQLRPVDNDLPISTIIQPEITVLKPNPSIESCNSTSYGVMLVKILSSNQHHFTETPIGNGYETPMPSSPHR